MIYDRMLKSDLQRMAEIAQDDNVKDIIGRAAQTISELERFHDFFIRYVENDLESADPDYVRDVLDSIGVNSADLVGTSLEYLLQERSSVCTNIL